MKKKEKTNFLTENIVGIVIVLVLIVVLVLNIIFTKNQNNNETSDTVSGQTTQETSNPLIAADEKWDQSEEKELPEIDYAQFKKDLKSKSVIVVMLGSEGCSWCQFQKPVLRHALYVYDKVNVKYLNLGNISEDDYNNLKKLHDDLKEFGTPTFVALKNGKVIDVQSGARNMANLKTMFEKMGAM